MKPILPTLLLSLLALTACQNTTPIDPDVPDPNPDPPGTFEPVSFRVNSVASGQGIVWSMKFAPDGRLFFTVKSPSTVQVRALNLQTRAIETFSSTSSVRNDGGEGGVLGLELDPNFAQNNRVYMCYSYVNSADTINNKRNRVSMYTILAGGLNNEQVLLDEMLGWGNHNGCRLAFGPDGKLYISMGDAADAPANLAGEADGPAKAQSLNLLTGKIFRINPDGSIPSDNPFYGSSTGSLRATWTYGHRNPQGLAFQPSTGLLWSTEHGQNTRDELNIITKGKNYGWPACIGTQRFNTTITTDGRRDCRASSTFPNLNASSYQPAVREYDGFDRATVAPSNLTFYQGNAFPALRGNLLFTTLKTKRLYRLQVNGEQVAAEQVLIDENRGFGRLRDVQVGPDGFIYIASDDGTIRRLEP